MTLGWFFAIFLWVAFLVSVIVIVVHECRKPDAQK